MGKEKNTVRQFQLPFLDRPKAQKSALQARLPIAIQASQTNSRCNDCYFISMKRNFLLYWPLPANGYHCYFWEILFVLQLRAEPGTSRCDGVPWSECSLWGADYILGWVPKLLINEVLNLMLKVVAVGSLMACSSHVIFTPGIRIMIPGRWI